MSVYICAECGEYKYDDTDPMEEGGLCPECYEDREALREWEREQRAAREREGINERDC